MVKTFKVHNLDCANCAAKVERALGKLDGVSSASVNFFAQKITVDVDPDRADDVMARVYKTCKKVDPDITVDR